MDADNQTGRLSENDTTIEAEEFLGYWLNDTGS